MAPPDSDRIMAGLTLTLYYPFEGKLIAHPLNGFNKQLSNGLFAYTNTIPQGTFRLVAMYVDYNQHPADTTLTTADVTVYPAIGAHDIRMRLNLDWNDK
jgi:hypothetical protein